MEQIKVEAQNVKRGDLFENGAWAKEDAYHNGETVIIMTSNGELKYFFGELVTVERN